MDKNKQQTVSPGLYLVSTPIGNMEDMTLRALNVLKKSCEDQKKGITTFIEVILNQELGEPFRRDA